LDRARLSSKGQLIIPKKCREKLNLKPGDQFSVVIKEGMLILQPSKSVIEGWQRWRGIFAGKKVLQEHLSEHFKEVDKYG